MNKIAVVGSGVVGLSTALSLQDSFPSTKITIFSDKFNEETLSSGAGGIFRVDLSIDPDEDKVRKWCQDSFSHYMNIICSSEASAAGMMLMSGYQLSSSTKQLHNSFLEELVPDYRKLRDIDLSLFPPHFKNGLFYTTIVADCRYYLPWMKARFEKAGGIVIKKHISSFSEIPDEFEIIINCTGLGAKELLDDPLLVPIRGQTIKVKAPWIKYFYYGDEVYIIPGIDYVTLGGIKDYGSANMKINSYQRQFIWDKCVELIPSLEKAEVLWDWVGLRPHRHSVRVDANFMKCSNSHRMVVNNYGHGSYGVLLSWGTAQEVVRLVQNICCKKEFIVSKL